MRRQIRKAAQGQVLVLGVSVRVRATAQHRPEVSVAEYGSHTELQVFHSHIPRETPTFKMHFEKFVKLVICRWGKSIYKCA